MWTAVQRCRSSLSWHRKQTSRWIITWRKDSKLQVACGVKGNYLHTLFIPHRISRWHWSPLTRCGKWQALERDERHTSWWTHFQYLWDSNLVNVLTVLHFPESLTEVRETLYLWNRRGMQAQGRQVACRFPHVRAEVTASAEPDSWKNKVEGRSTQQNKS